MTCMDKIQARCEVCGDPVPMDTVWHGKRWTYPEWLATYGAVCVYCQAKREYLARLRQQPQRRKRR